MTSNTRRRLSPLRAFNRVNLHRTAVDGWYIEGVGTSASEPVEPGTSVTFNVTASNASDDSIAEMPISGTTRTCEGGELTVPVLVNGQQVDTVTFRACVTGIDTESFAVTVPDANSMTVDVGGETVSLDVGTSELEPDEGTPNVSISGPTSLAVGNRATYEVTISCSGGTCDSAVLRIDIGGGTLFSQSRGPLEAGETLTESVTQGFETAGTVDVEAWWGQASDRLTVSVEATEPEFDPALVSVPSGECNVTPQSVVPPEAVELSATVRNRNDVPAAATVEWTWEGQRLATSGVNVSQNSNEIATAQATIEREGRGQVRAEVTNASESVEGLRPALAPAAESVRAGRGSSPSYPDF